MNCRCAAVSSFVLLSACGGGLGPAARVIAAPTEPAAIRDIEPPLRSLRGERGEQGAIVDRLGRAVQLRGVNRSGTEFNCLYGGFGDGPTDREGALAMKRWQINAVRVPLNEDCWLGINGVPPRSGGASYREAVKRWVTLLTDLDLVVILDLHWTAPGRALANRQAPMADRDHSVDLWREVASAYKDNGLVVFDLFNEPFVSDWRCWAEGGTCAESNGAAYEVAGMATMLQAVRGAGADNVVLLGGLSYAADLSEWVATVDAMKTLPPPIGPVATGNIAASWHVYDFNEKQSGCPSRYNDYRPGTACNSGIRTATSAAADRVLTAGFPLVVGEVGISIDTRESAARFSIGQVVDIETWLEQLLSWADSHGQGYLGWSWNRGTPPALVTDFEGTASPGFGAIYRRHLLRRAPPGGATEAR